VAVDVAVPAARVQVRAFALPVRAVLGGMVAASFALRWLLARAHETPYYFPDEYLYPSFARGIATGGVPSVRGETVSFPALLEPLLTAPAWLTGDTQLAYALTQGIHSFVMSLAAVPAYLLCRRLGLRTSWSLGAALLALAAPALTYSGWMLADPVAYPLVLAAIWAGVSVLERPSPRGQLVFLGLAGLAAFARMQFVVVPALFAVAALVVEGGSFRRVLRSYRIVLGCLAVPLVAGAVLGLDRVLGYYAVIMEADVSPADVVRWAGSDGMIVAYAAGWLLVPGAVLGLAFGIARAQSRAERGFAALTALLALTLVGQAALFAANTDDVSVRVHERYTLVLVPLAVVAFLVYAHRGFPGRKALALVAAGMVALSAWLPLSGYTVGHGKDDSPTLRAVQRLSQELGVANGSLAVAILAGLFSALAVAVTLRPRRAVPVVLGLTLLTMTAVTAGAVSYDRLNARYVLADALPDGRDWVDRRGLEHVSLVQLPGADRSSSFEQLFWNRSIERIVLLGSPPIDAFAAEGGRIARDGSLLAEGRPLKGPLVLQTWAAQAQLSGVEELESNHGFLLVRPRGKPRLRLLAPGFFGDGWVAPDAEVTVWPSGGGRLEGTLTLALSLPGNAARSRIDLRGPGVRRTVVVEPGGRTEVDLPVRSAGPWTVKLDAKGYGWLGGRRPVSVRAEPPVFLESSG
jgi:hypothetical protein